MGLKNDATLVQPLATVGAQVGGEAVARGSAGFVNTYRPEQWLTGLTEPPGLSARNKSRHFDNEGCEAVTNQASFRSEPLVAVGRGWL